MSSFLDPAQPVVNSTGAKILTADWFSMMMQLPNTVTGAVLIETTEGNLKGYMGTVHGGFDEVIDALKISERGAKLTPAVVRAMFPAETADKEIID